MSTIILKIESEYSSYDGEEKIETTKYTETEYLREVLSSSLACNYVSELLKNEDFVKILASYGFADVSKQEKIGDSVLEHGIYSLTNGYSGAPSGILVLPETISDINLLYIARGEMRLCKVIDNNCLNKVLSPTKYKKYVAIKRKVDDEKKKKEELSKNKAEKAKERKIKAAKKLLQQEGLLNENGSGT